MEQFRRKRSQSARAPSPSKVTTIVNRSSNSNPIACDGPQRGSNLRHKFPKVEPDPRSYDCDKSMDNHKIAFESGQRSLKGPAGTPMKSLLADEMCRESEYTTRTPGVVAKLMGLDGMPSQQSFYKQPIRSSDGCHQKTVPAGSLRHGKACHNQSCKKIPREQYKDVYEVRESARNRTAACNSLVPANMMHAEDEIILMKAKCMDAKRFSTDKSLRKSKEFHGETEVSDSSNYLLLKYLEEPDSLFAKHLHNLHASQETRCENVRNLKVPNRLNNNIDAVGHLTDIEASNKIDISMSQECKVGRHHKVPHNRVKASDLHKSATFCSEGNELPSDVPTNIVVLKPNIEGLRKSAKSSSSSSSCELLSNGDTRKTHGRRQSCGKNKLPIALDMDAHKSRDSRELARQITRQMRNNLGDSFYVPLSRRRGKSVEDSSHGMSGNDSSFESFGTFLTSHISARPSFHRKSSASLYTESSVTREAKKRLSERWEMSQRSEKFSVGAKGGTLGQMLAIYDTDVRLPGLGGEMTEGRPSSSFSRNRKFSGVVEPLGISSKDGWRDGHIRTLSRAEHLPTAYDRFGSPKISARYEDWGTEKLLMPKEGSRNSRENEVNKEFSWNEGLSTGNVKLRDKKVNDDTHASQVRRKGKKRISQPKNSLVHEPVARESSTCRLDTMLTLDSETVKEYLKIPGCVASSEDVIPAPEFTSLQVKNGSSSSGLHEIAQELSEACCIDNSQHCGAQPESPTGNKEADHPSPVSVLDTPCVEDLSSGSECFERVSADLHGLRMQLKLLKLETGSYTASSSDEDEPSLGSSGGANRCADSDNWEASYKADVLAEYEFNGATWPLVGPHVFEKLERKYSYPIASCSRSDRRLFFDHINSCTLEISQRFTDRHPLARPSKAWFEVELCRLLEAESKQEKEDVAFLHSKKEWMDLGKCIEEIGCEIGEILLDELVSEALAM